MIDRLSRTRALRAGLGVGVLGAALVLAGCSSSSSSTPPDNSVTPSDTTPASGVPAAVQELVDAGYKGTFQAPPSTGPAAVKGKKVWVISCGQISQSCTDLATPAMEAGKAIGWDMTLFDGKLQPATWPQGINQAVAAGADGIITVAADCGNSKAALEAAKKAGVVLIGLAAFDCNDPNINAGAPVFSSQVLYSGIDSYGASYSEWAKMAVAWTIAQTDGQTQLISTTSPGFTVAKWHDAGVAAAIGMCPTCKLLETVGITPADQASGQAVQKMQVSLQKNADANALYGEVNGWYPGFISAAMKATNRTDLAATGAGCGAANLAEIKAGGPQTGCVAKSEAWEAWAGVDEMNRQFAQPGSAPVEQGLGFQIVDKDHNLPSGDSYVPPVDFRAAYQKVWNGG